MNLLSFPDIAAMLMLMGVLFCLRRRYRDESVDLWLLGLTFILLEAVAVSLIRSGSPFARLFHTLALDCYVAAAVTFGWAARQDLMPGRAPLPVFLPPAVPLLAIATLYGLEYTGRLYFLISIAALVLGTLHVLVFMRRSYRLCAILLGIHFSLWVPMAFIAFAGNLRLLVYWGLGCLYLLVAVAFRKRVRNSVGGKVIVAGFILWAACFFAHPLVRSHPLANGLVDELWTMQKFFVIIGMLLVLLEDQTRLREQEAMHDALTGLPNRRLFEDRLTQAVQRARRTGHSTAVFVVDLNNFKQINDTHGHSAGDLVLCRATDELLRKIRSSDTLSRWGGDEFSVIVNDLTRPEDCERIAATLRTAIMSVQLPAGAHAPLSASVGYALFPDDVSDPTELYELADIRMYKDKRQLAIPTPIALIR